MDAAETEATTRAEFELRPLEPADAARIAELANDLEVTRWLARLPHPYGRADAEAFLGAEVELVAAGDAMSRAIVVGGRLAGIVGASDIASGTPELGYWLGRAYWGRGIASHAAAALLGELIAAHDPARIASGAFEGNAASLRIQAKLGFVEIGRSRRHCRALGCDMAHVDTLLTRRTDP